MGTRIVQGFSMLVDEATNRPVGFRDPVTAREWFVPLFSGTDLIDPSGNSVAVGGTPGDGSISTAKLEDGAATAAKIAADAVTETKLAADAVTSAKIADAAVTADKVPDGELPAAKLAPIAASAVLANSDNSDPATPTAVPFADLPVSAAQEARHGKLPIRDPGSSSSYTFALSDLGQRVLRRNGSTAHTTIIPADSSVQFAEGDWILIGKGTGTGAMTVQGAATVTIVGPTGLVTESAGIYSFRVPQDATCKLQKLATANAWRVIELHGFTPLLTVKGIQGAPAAGSDDAVGLAMRLDAENAFRMYLDGVEIGPPTYTWSSKPTASVDNVGAVIKIVDSSNPFFAMGTLFECVARTGGVYRWMPLNRRLRFQDGPRDNVSAVAAAAASAMTTLESDTFPPGLVVEGCRVTFRQLNQYTDSGSTTKDLRCELAGTAILDTTSTAGGLSGYQFKDVFVRAESGSNNCVCLTGGSGAISAGTASNPTQLTADFTAGPTVAWGFQSATTANTGLCVMREVEIEFPEA